MYGFLLMWIFCIDMVFLVNCLLTCYLYEEENVDAVRMQVWQTMVLYRCNIRYAITIVIISTLCWLIRFIEYKIFPSEHLYDSVHFLRVTYLLTFMTEHDCHFIERGIVLCYMLRSIFNEKKVVCGQVESSTSFIRF